MTTPLFISAEQARRLVLNLQGLTRNPGRAINNDQLYDLIEAMGYVQLDSVQVVARAHHMILQTRSQSYRPHQLDRLHAKEARLFENWTHDACLIPTSFFPYWQHRFDRDAKRLAERFTKWRGHDFRPVLDAVRNRIAQEGPLRARDFEEDRPKGGAGWWDWHASKTALEYLWRTGELAVARREGFQKLYDLTERVIPRDHIENRCSHEDFVDWACRAAIHRLGVAAPGEIARFFDSITPKEATEWCERQGPESLIPVQVAAIDGSKPRKAFARPDIETLMENAEEAPARVRTLSPFDPVLRDRNRLKRLFNLDYRIEIFVPAPKRQYGYYVFPLLEGEKIIGRIDMKGDRASDALHVTAFWPERGIRMGAGRLQKLDSELERQARFIGMSNVSWANGAMREPK